MCHRSKAVLHHYQPELEENSLSKVTKFQDYCSWTSHLSLQQNL